MKSGSFPDTPTPPMHTLEPPAVAAELQVDPAMGLTPEEAARRLAHYGPNELGAAERSGPLRVFARQFMDVLILILIVAAVVSLFIGETTDAIAIAAIVLINGILGFVQEWKAEKAIEALQQMLQPSAVVVRDGERRSVDAKELVPGDVVLLEAGERVPADIRLVQVAELAVDESSLTGESESVRKSPAFVAADAHLAERTCMAYMGTTITNGNGVGLITATGAQTEFGRIAGLTSEVDREPTPLQRRLTGLGKTLAFAALFVSLAVFIAGWLLGKPLVEMFLTGVSLAVAVVPEGLPAVVTLTLALGVRAMVKRKALLRRLQAAETLGSTTVICTDKTGTLTQNRMTVQEIHLFSETVTVTGSQDGLRGEFYINDQKIVPASREDLQALLETGVICNHSRLMDSEGTLSILGESTEAALAAVGIKAGLKPTDSPFTTEEIPFNSERKRMTIVEHRPEGSTAHVKGAPEVILERCTRVMDGEYTRPLNDKERDKAERMHQQAAERGLRVLALARRELPAGTTTKTDPIEEDLTLLGFVGIVDPPHDEVSEAVTLARRAGIRVVMITGDSPVTALAIARAVNIPAERALTGREVSELSDEELLPALEQDVVFARTTPEHKLRIVGLFQSAGHVAAMTGDGVNDAPALKKADIGIAMGLRGTDAAKGASDMVLTDDNFASIVNAVEEGRRQYDNIQKFVRYLLSSNMGEVVAVFINILLGGPLIFLPVQILWMNLVTDGMSAVTLGLEPAEKQIMDRPPRKPEEPVLTRTALLSVLLLGGYMGLASLWLFHHYMEAGRPDAALIAQTTAFTGLVLMEKANVFNFRGLTTSIFSMRFFSNPWLLLGVAGALGLQTAAVYVPFLQKALHTAPLGLQDWGLMLLTALPVLVLGEVLKAVLRSRRRRG